MAVRWVPVRRGDDLPAGAVRTGSTGRDGDVYVARSRGGACGKLNLDGGKVWNIWCHGEPQMHEGEVLTVKHQAYGVAHWVPLKRGDDLPVGCIRAGATGSDGDVYVARNANGAGGKLNLQGGKMHNIWCHGDHHSAQEGDILTVEPYLWMPVKRGDDLPFGCVHTGSTGSDGDVYVARNVASGACGKLNLDNGKVWNIWCHGSGSTQEGEILVAINMVPTWSHVKRGDELPAGCILAGSTRTDGDVYVARNASGAGGKLNLDAGKMHNIWCHGDRAAAQEGEVLTAGALP